MSYHLIAQRAVITERRIDGWIAYVSNAPAVCGRGATEQAALDALRALLTPAAAERV